MKLALIDIDGVLANDTHRVQDAIEKNWTEYFDPERMAQDSVWPQGRELVERLEDDGWTIAYLTGRRDDRREVTEDWLLKNDFPWGKLIMRDFESKAVRLAELKARIVKKLVNAGRFEVVVLYDDDPEVFRTVSEVVGRYHVVHCTWHIKQEALIRTAVA